MKTHRTDGVSLSFGIVFLFIVVWWLIAQFVTLALPAIGWMVAVALIVFGVFGLVGAFRSGRGAVPAPTSGAPVSAVAAGGVPAGLHADIVRELMENQRTSGSTESSAGLGIDQTRVEPPAPTASFAPIRSSEPPSPYATDYLTVSDPDSPSSDEATDVASDEDRTEVVDETPTKEIRTEGDGERR
ncbi:DUF308 domain-containing protein [Catenuloplanes japonicus]|uniref:DUF308 domain-containing protein n=1 Tax=Catenuloplanes japonicus TaxID=33876 RepID=UPI0007C5D5A4|nr:DUF308 domain-containing protein [Catenuloplanes japonicus]